MLNITRQKRIYSRIRIVVGRRITLTTALLIVIAFVRPQCVVGQDSQVFDQVWVRNSKTGNKSDAEIRYRGRIQDFNGQRLDILIGESDLKRSFDTETITRIDAVYLAEHQSAVQAMNEGQFQTAFDLLNQAIEKEPRAWMKREIMSLQMQILARTDQLAAHSQIFVKLLQSEQQNRFAFRIPLLWLSRNIDAAQEAVALEYMRSENEWLGLMGASWLLGGAQRNAATSKLEGLSNSIDPQIAELATAQLWRTQLLTAKNTDITRWNTLVQRMKPSFRFGPMLLVGSAQARLAQSNDISKDSVDEAVTGLMRIPILYPTHYHESAEALYVAGRLLEYHRRVDEATVVYVELLREFGQSTSATKSRQSKLVQELISN